MQKFIVKKPTRGTIVTIVEEDNCDSSDSNKRTCVHEHENFCEFKKEFSISDSNLGAKLAKNVKMCGYLKKKRNVSELNFNFDFMIFKSPDLKI